ncbi:MAG TPA: FliH/SctL family protein [Gemmatimonadaceae bacterium]|nr:FliH/SctL family protein [Gemmatimonadaceae bacterium]
MSGPKVDAHSTVRVAHASDGRPSTPWAPDEITLDAIDPLDDRTAAEQALQFSAAEREQLLEDAYTRGLTEGLARGARETERRMADAGAVLTEAVQQLEATTELAPGILEENVAALAVMVARQIVAREVAVQPQVIADLVRRALTEFPVDQTLRIRVNPLDLSLLSGPATTGTAVPITGTRDASWLADGRIARGGCLIEGRDRIVDGRVDTALERAYRRMAAIDAA